MFGQDEQHVLEVVTPLSAVGARRLPKIVVSASLHLPPFPPYCPIPYFVFGCMYVGTMRPIIEKDLGRRVTEVFSSINTVPLASASIAQVTCACAAAMQTSGTVVFGVK